MEQRIYHGDLTPKDFAEALLAYFNRGNMRTQTIGNDDELRVQIATRPGAASGGETAVTVQLKKVEDGISVSLSEQAWLGLAASMGQTVIYTLMNPWNLLGRLDDLAQDVENLQIGEKVWQVIGSVAQSHNSSTQISERLQRLECLFCGTANVVGQGSCIACGAPLGNIQPRTCPNCGFVVLRGEKSCPSCNKLLPG
ncbi:MAG: zinc ribbon domain-containing protein [Chloroflexota bacterium]